MDNIHRLNWSRVNLYQKNFVGYCAHLPSYQLAIKTIILSTLTVTSAVLAGLTAVFVIGLRSLETDFLSSFARLTVVLLAIAGLIIAYRRGFFTFVGLGITTFVALGILLLALRISPVINAFSTIPFTITSELLALWLSAITFASSRALSKKVLLPLIIFALFGVGITLSLVKPFMSLPELGWAYSLMATSILFTGGSIGWNAFNSNTRFPRIAQLANYLTVIGGTSFYQANLTEANFSKAVLKHTDFRDANLTRTCWHSAKGLEFARLGNTYLANPKIRQLVVSCNGQEQNFDGLDLTGVNLQDANLQDISFIGASLNQSNLRGADLSRAILKQTRLDGADLSGAILTGAYIEDWGITSTTNLKSVQCEYIYMRVPTKENPNPLRKPDNLRETFAEGEFADFIQPFFDTLDLYHSQDVDPRAISIALRNLSASHPDDNLQFVAIERRGGNGINLRFTTAPRANKSELSHEYFANYTQIKKELPVAVQMQLAEQDAEIRTLKGTIEQFIQTGTHQSTIQAETIQVIQGELVVTENRGIHINAGDNVNISGLSSGDGVVNLGTISGNVANAINQLPEASELDQPNLKELLTQLQQAIQADADLLDPDKSDLLEQVQALAEAKQIEEPTKREGLTRKAMKMFDATLKSLPETAKIAEACSKLLPMILRALGFPA
jgi:uncharacterized protein YjbI with pentapeptide repeats